MKLSRSGWLSHRFIFAVAISLLASAAALIASPVILFMLLLFGIAGFPYAALIIMVALFFIVFLPGIIMNVYLTQGFSVIQKITSVVVYLLIFVGLVFLFFTLVKGGFQSIGQF